MIEGCICSNGKVTEKGLMIWGLQNPICPDSSSGAILFVVKREYMQGVLIVDKVRPYSEITHNNKKEKQD